MLGKVIPMHGEPQVSEEGGDFFKDAFRTLLEARDEIKGYRGDLLDKAGPLARVSDQVAGLKSSFDTHSRQYGLNWGLLRGEIQGIRGELEAQAGRLGGLEDQVISLKQQLADVLLRLGLLEGGARPIGIKVPNGAIRVLLVEDTVELRRTIERVLIENGMKVRAVGTLEEARRELVGEDVEVVLADLRLPDGSGLELLGLPREPEAGLEVIVMSALELDDFATDALQQGAYGVLEKPFRSLSQLVVLVQRAAERRRLLVFKQRVSSAGSNAGTSAAK